MPLKFECSSEIPPIEKIECGHYPPIPNVRRWVDTIISVMLKDIVGVEVIEENVRKITRVCWPSQTIEDKGAMPEKVKKALEDLSCDNLEPIAILTRPMLVKVDWVGNAPFYSEPISIEQFVEGLIKP